MNSFQLAIRAQAIAETLAQVTGHRPTIAYGSGFARLYWTPAQQQILSTQLGRHLDRAAIGALKPGQPGPIRVEYAPVINAAVSKRAAPIAMAAAALLIGLGFVLGKGGHRWYGRT
jgi:hypothetical protein